MVETLPKKGLDVIDQYLHLTIADQIIRCPYFKNTTIARGMRVVVGKGSPRDIVDEVIERARKERIELPSLSGQQIRDFLIERKLGIDCSGFIAQVFDAIDPAIVKNLSIERGDARWLKRWFVNRFRKIENLSVRALTLPENAECIDSFHDAKPGDLIRTRNGDHVLLITEVKGSPGHVKEIMYTHSTLYYEGGSGVRQGVIKIVYPQEALQDQEWDEVDQQTGQNYTLEGYLEGGADSGIYRLKNAEL